MLEGVRHSVYRLFSKSEQIVLLVSSFQRCLLHVEERLQVLCATLQELEESFLEVATEEVMHRRENLQA